MLSIPARRSIDERQPRSAKRLTSRSLRGVPSGLDVKLKRQPAADHLNDGLGQLTDAQVHAGSDIHGLETVVVIHQEQAGAREVIHVQELTLGARCPKPGALTFRLEPPRAPCAAAPVRRGCSLGLSPGVEVCRHSRDKIAAILAPVGLTQLDPSDLSDRVRFVGRLEHAGQQAIFRHRLGRELRIDARAPKEGAS